MPLQATSGAASYDAFGGGVPVEPNYIESVFQTWLYTGNGSTQTITNGIDLSTKGGLVWIKSRSNAKSNSLFDTARGAYQWLTSNASNASTNFSPNSLTSFNSNGFSLLDDATSTYAVNGTNYTYASWTFRKQPKFFDIVTYTGDGIAGKTISHSLGSVPGCMIVKCTSTANAWFVYHTSIGATKALILNATSSAQTGTGSWNDTEPTSTQFTVGDFAQVNTSGDTYVAYLFAHNAGGFGLTGTDNVISCGTYSTDPNKLFGTVELGFEPQWILSKATGTGAWFLQDMMRGDPVGGPVQNLLPNTSGTEVTRSANDASNGVAWPTPTGFSGTAPANSTFIYIAIRRGPMKVPTSGTSVFEPISNAAPTTGPLTDLTINRGKSSGNSTWAISRLTNAALETNSTNAETATGAYVKFDRMQGVTDSGWLGTSNVIWWNFQRAPSFFDEVCYTGTGSATTQTHNLQAVPELIIVKKRNVDSTTNWYVYSAATGNTQVGVLSGTNAFFTNSSYWNNTTPTSSVFSLGTGSNVNQSGTLFVSYLFATAAGVSKVGSYTGTATTKQIDCGFTAGARFVLIKRTDQTSDWYVWDTARGIVSGNDPYLLLNSTATEVTSTDYIDTYSAGFELSSTAPAAINTSGGSFIFLAIA